MRVSTGAWAPEPARATDPHTLIRTSGPPPPSRHWGRHGRPAVQTRRAPGRLEHQGGRRRPASPSQPPDQWKQQCGVLMNATPRFYEARPEPRTRRVTGRPGTAPGRRVLRIGFPRHIVVTGHTGRTGPEEGRESTGDARPAVSGPGTLAPHPVDSRGAAHDHRTGPRDHRPGRETRPPRGTGRPVARAGGSRGAGPHRGQGPGRGRRPDPAERPSTHRGTAVGRGLRGAQAAGAVRIGRGLAVAPGPRALLGVRRRPGAGGADGPGAGPSHSAADRTDGAGGLGGPEPGRGPLGDGRTRPRRSGVRCRNPRRAGRGRAGACR